MFPTHFCTIFRTSIRRSLTELGVEELRKFVEIGLPSVLLELLGQLLSIVFGAGSEVLHFFGSDDAVIIVVDDPEEGLVEVLIAWVRGKCTDIRHYGGNNEDVEGYTADQDGLFDHDILKSIKI